MTRQILHFPEYACDVCGYTSAGQITGDHVKVSQTPPPRWFESDSSEKPSKRRHYCSFSCLTESSDYGPFMYETFASCVRNCWPLPEEFLEWYFGMGWGKSYVDRYEEQRCRDTESKSPSTSGGTSRSTVGSADSGSRERLPKSGRLVGFIFAIKE